MLICGADHGTRTRDPLLGADVAISRRSKTPIIVAVVSATVLVLTIGIGRSWVTFPEALWVLLAPIGMFSGGLVCIVSLVLLFIRLARALEPRRTLVSGMQCAQNVRRSRATGEHRTGDLYFRGTGCDETSAKRDPARSGSP